MVIRLTYLALIVSVRGGSHWGWRLWLANLVVWLIISRSERFLKEHVWLRLLYRDSALELVSWSAVLDIEVVLTWLVICGELLYLRDDWLWLLKSCLLILIGIRLALRSPTWHLRFILKGSLMLQRVPLVSCKCVKFYIVLLTKLL